VGGGPLLRFCTVRRKVLLAAILASSLLGTVGAGIYFEHYFVVFVFGMWFGLEFVLWRFPLFKSRPTDALVDWYRHQNAPSSNEVETALTALHIQGRLNPTDQRWVECFRALVELRALVQNERPKKGKQRIRQAFVYCSEPIKRKGRAMDSVAVEDITDCATQVADLYLKLYDACTAPHPELMRIGRQLFAEIFDTPFESTAAHAKIESLTDSMQRDMGFPFLILNLIRSGQGQWSRQIAQGLLRQYEEVELAEEVRSSLYWVSEIHWFVHENRELITDYESCIRYLYHLCFVNPERAGFLEIDSQFFSQFETITELAREGFLFKEVLIEKILSLWKEHPGCFDQIFQNVLESITQTKSKIYDERENWERYWRRESENFSRDYLYVVEGNLSYATGHLEDARVYYEKALELNPRLRSALFNIIFCYAKLGLIDLHSSAVQRIMKDKTLLPSGYFIVGDSYLLLGKDEEAERYYLELTKQEGWAQKIDYYKSTFCYEQGLHEKALEFAEKAHHNNPADTAMNYHLSLCYNALGKKDQALDMVKKMGESPTWLNYYKFTLERDSGRHHDASETLLRIPREYFQDPEELDAAVDFAKHRKDLVLLRHLRNKIS